MSAEPLAENIFSGIALGQPELAVLARFLLSLSLSLSRFDVVNALSARTGASLLSPSVWQFHLPTAAAALPFSKIPENFIPSAFHTLFPLTGRRDSFFSRDTIALEALVCSAFSAPLFRPLA